MTCPACGADVPEGARFCPSCGTPQTVAPDERRIVTVVMADIVGFTTMSEGADPEHVKEVVDRCFERLMGVVREYGGTLDKIVGDELVATFGVPRAHEDDAERAVRAAIAMREAMASAFDQVDRELQLRIGINTGEVLVGSLRAGGDPTVMGDVVNTASRLQHAAEPGTIVVGESTHAATESSIEYRALGPVQLRGRNEPVEAWEAVVALTPPGRRNRVRQERSPLVGRDLEMTTLNAALDHVLGRRSSFLTMLAGEAGVGKQRLVVETCARAGAHPGAEILAGNCVPYGESNPWAPIADALRTHLDVGAEATHASVEAAVARVLADRAESTEQIERTAAAVADALTGTVREEIDRGRALAEQARGIVALVDALLSSGPLVVAIADIQWADPELLELVAHMVDYLRRQPLLMMLTSREPHLPGWSAPTGGNVVSLRVDALDETATVELASALLGGPITPAFGALLYERTGGNPLFVEELTACLEPVGDPADDALLAQLRSLPATLHGLIAARLDGMDEAKRSLIDDFAVIGATGPTAAALNRSGRHGSDPLVRSIETDGVISFDGDTFRFNSQMTRDVAYQTLSKAERARRHAAALEWFENDGDGDKAEVAHHAGVAASLAADLGGVDGLPVDLRDRAIGYLEVAAGAAEHNEAWLSAHTNWETLLTLLEPSDTDALRRARLGLARADQGRQELDAAFQAASEVAAQAQADGDHRSVAQAESILGGVMQRRNDYDAADEHLARARDLYRNLGDERAVAETLRMQGTTRLFAGDFANAEALIAEALATFSHLDDTRGEALSLQNLAWISFVRSHISEAEERLNRSVDLFERLGDWGGLSWALGLMAYIRLARGQLDEAEALGERILAESEESGNRWAQAMMCVLLANTALWTGRCELSLERARRADRAFAEMDDGWGQVQALAPQLRALSRLGRTGEYEAALGRTTARAHKLDDPSQRQIPAALHASVLNDRGEGAAALRVLQADAGEWGGLSGFERSTALALAHVQTGDPIKAIELIEDHYSRATDDGPRANMGSVLALALAAVGRVDEADAVLREVETMGGGTWVDRLRCELAAACVAARQSDAGTAAARIKAARELVSGTDALLDAVTTEVAVAAVAEALDDADASEALRRAERELAQLGMRAPGWTTAYRLACGLSAQPSPAGR